MPQMHPLLWAFLFSFSLTCLIFAMTITFFSFGKSSSARPSTLTAQTMNLIWKW